MNEGSSQEGQSIANEPASPFTYTATDFPQDEGQISNSVQPVTWTASEFVVNEKPPMWFAAFFGITAFIVILVLFITRDIVATVVTFLSCAALGFYTNHRPGTRSYVVDEHGVTVDQKSHSFSEFRSFSVVEEGGIDSIWLKPLKRFMPMVVMYYAPDDEEKIISVLSSFLPHEQRELDAIDRLSKKLKF